MSRDCPDESRLGEFVESPLHERTTSQGVFYQVQFQVVAAKLQSHVLPLFQNAVWPAAPDLPASISPGYLQLLPPDGYNSLTPVELIDAYNVRLENHNPILQNGPFIFDAFGQPNSFIPGSISCSNFTFKEGRDFPGLDEFCGHRARARYSATVKAWIGRLPMFNEPATSPSPGHNYYPAFTPVGPCTYEQGITIPANQFIYLSPTDNVSDTEYMRILVVSETPAHWSARTGVTLV